MALSRRSIFSARPLARFSLPAQLSAAALPRRIAPPVNRRRAIPDRRDVDRQLSDVNGLIRYATARDRPRNRRWRRAEIAARIFRDRR